MLKNKAWIVALIVALTMAFIGCTDAGNYEPPPKAMVEDRFELGAIGWKGGQPDNQQGWYSIGYDDDGLLGTPVATVKQFIEAEYLVAQLKTVPSSISGETANISVIWGGDGEGWKSGTAKTISTAAGSAIRYDAAKQEVWVKLSETLVDYADYQALKTGARLVLQSWNLNWDIATGFLVKMVEEGEESGPSGAVPGIYVVPVAQSEEPTEDYYEPAATIDNVFYLNLNDFKTKGVLRDGATAGSDVLVDGELTADDVTVKFVKRDQSVHFKLSGAQAEKVWEADAAKVTITLATGSATGTFRYTFTDPSKAGSWNAGNLPTAFGNAEAIGFNDNKSGNTVAFLSIQVRQDAAVDLKIASIKVEVVYKTFAGTLGAEELASGTDGKVYHATYTGTEKVDYTWTRSTGKKVTVLGTGSSVFIHPYTGVYELTISAFGYKSESYTVDTVVCPCIASTNPADCICAAMDECDCGPCNVWSEIQDDLTVIANLDNVFGLMKGGNFSVGLTSDGALFVFDRLDNWGNGVDLQIKTTAGTVQAWEVPIDPAKTYKLTVTGKAQGGVMMKVAQSGSPYGTFADQTLTGTDADIKDFSLTVTKNIAGDADLLGSDLLAQGVRIQTTDATPYAFFLIETVVIQELGAGGAVAATPLNFPND